MILQISTPSLLLFSLLCMNGCRSESQDTPPTIRFGDSVCDECGMIISDERFATASIIAADRGPHPTLFDDYNCQIKFEKLHTDITVLKRWSHDYQSSEWINTDSCWFVQSDTIKSPMASHLAAFELKADAQAFATESNGQLYQFDQLLVSYTHD